MSTAAKRPAPRIGAYPRLLRHGIFPLLDRLNGTRVGRELSFLERSQWWEADALEKLQADKLARLLAWTRANSDFYRTHWDSAPRPAQSAYPSLDGMPIVTKADLRAAAAGAFPLAAYQGKVFKNFTSGSTGNPMTFYRSWEQESWFWALRLRMWQWGGYVFGEPYVTLNLNARIAWKKRLQDVLFRCSYNGFNANTHDVDVVLRDMKQRRIPHMIGYASSLFLLGRAMKERGAANPGVRSILSTGDTLLPSYRALVQEVFGVKVIDYYGAGGEGLHLASQCERAERYHLHPENAVIEIIKDGRPARPGEMGEIVVTQLDNFAMPLVRYSTEDLAVAAPADAACACGRRAPVLQSIEGRVPDIVFAPDGTHLVVHFFTILFEYLPGIAQFQVVQREPGEIVARIVPAPDCDRAAIEKKVREDVARATHGTLAVRFEYVQDIPLSTSMKRRFVISEVRPAPSGSADVVSAAVR